MFIQLNLPRRLNKGIQRHRVTYYTSCYIVHDEKGFYASILALVENVRLVNDSLFALLSFHPQPVPSALDCSKHMSLHQVQAFGDLDRDETRGHFALKLINFELKFDLVAP